jgi:hypothetical protein
MNNFFKGFGNNTNIYFSKFQRGFWNTQKIKIEVVRGTSDGPAVAATQGVLYLAWRAEPEDNRIL